MEFVSRSWVELLQDIFHFRFIHWQKEICNRTYRPNILGIPCSNLRFGNRMWL